MECTPGTETDEAKDQEWPDTIPVLSACREADDPDVKVQHIEWRSAQEIRGEELGLPIGIIQDRLESKDMTQLRQQYAILLDRFDRIEEFLIPIVGVNIGGPVKLGKKDRAKTVCLFKSLGEMVRGNVKQCIQELAADEYAYMCKIVQAQLQDHEKRRIELDRKEEELVKQALALKEEGEWTEQRRTMNARLDEQSDRDFRYMHIRSHSWQKYYSKGLMQKWLWLWRRKDASDIYVQHLEAQLLRYKKEMKGLKNLTSKAEEQFIDLKAQLDELTAQSKADEQKIATEQELNRALLADIEKQETDLTAITDGKIQQLKEVTNIRHGLETENAKLHDKLNSMCKPKLIRSSVTNVFTEVETPSIAELLEFLRPQSRKLTRRQPCAEAATVMVHQEIQTEPLWLSHKPEVAVEKLATQLEEWKEKEAYYRVNMGAWEALANDRGRQIKELEKRERAREALANNQARQIKELEKRERAVTHQEVQTESTEDLETAGTPEKSDMSSDSEESADSKFMVQQLRKLDEKYEALECAHQMLQEEIAEREQFESALYQDNVSLHTMYLQATDALQDVINRTRPGYHIFAANAQRPTFAGYKLHQQQLAQAAEKSKQMNDMFTAQCSMENQEEEQTEILAEQHA